MFRQVSKRVWGWWFFDWASQPYNTLLLTFIFGPYVKELLGDGTRAQAAWGYGVGITGLIIAILSPVLGAIADRAGGRMRFIWLFSAMYVVGAWGLWWAAPDNFNLVLILLSFGIGLIGMEFATTFTNAMLPDLGSREEIGRISGSGWAFGYVGGLLALILMLAVFQTDPQTGKTMVGLPPMFGLDPAAREGTRIVGPLTAIWYVVFMIPFFLWVREPRKPDALPMAEAVRRAVPELKESLRRLPRNRSLSAFLLSSMFYRDALNGIFVFGGLYAAGVLDWSVVDTGKFGLLAIVTGALFAWIGGRADDRFGPKAVIALCVIVLTALALAVVFVSRDSVFGMPVPPESNLPDMVFYAIGGMIGAAGGALQSASRSMMVRQAERGRMTEAFGLYALAGKATSFIAPLSIGIVTDMTGSQQLGILPLIALFLVGLFLLGPVDPKGAPEEAPT
ncbi:UMF1 family MFS transporter [Albidovulum inexpectatum]|uniref:UMF1 family MFS transporter n=1 Tax=Albidovulum inexpectatum TaxID=196587 RepID=A0A2S5JDW4_9RHOB|nr:MFS transporter [Albidovulum inexpectatum]PPB79643.1 UMF1 family MFS transporter [Albidovulum inexpectatum]